MDAHALAIWATRSKSRAPFVEYEGNDKEWNRNEAEDAQRPVTAKVCKSLR